MLCLVEPIEAPSTAGDCFGIWDLGFEMFFFVLVCRFKRAAELHPKPQQQISARYDKAQNLLAVPAQHMIPHTKSQSGTPLLGSVKSLH